MRAGDVYLCDLGNNIGSIQKGARPCVIIDNNMAISFSPCIHCVPLTAQIQKDFILHYSLNREDYNFLNHNSLALCEQYQLIDKSQLIRKMGNINQKDLVIITELCKKNFPFSYK